MLDSGPLGQIAHPRPNREITDWFEGLLRRGAFVVLPEIADYEVRRGLLHAGLTASVARLDELKTALNYLPLNTPAMHRAAQLWADARRQGNPTADPHALDGDVILAAQAEQAGAMIATDNVGHLSLFVEAKNWREIT